MARAAKRQKEKTLEEVLWNCRVALRGVGSIEKNRDAVISLVFLKFAGDKFEARRKELTEEYGNIPAFLEKPAFYNAATFFICPRSRAGHIWSPTRLRATSPSGSTLPWPMRRRRTRRSRACYP